MGAHQFLNDFGMKSYIRNRNVGDPPYSLRLFTHGMGSFSVVAKRRKSLGPVSAWCAPSIAFDGHNTEVRFYRSKMHGPSIEMRSIALAAFLTRTEP
jgi:hypothetical protein